MLIVSIPQYDKNNHKKGQIFIKYATHHKDKIIIALQKTMPVQKNNLKDKLRI